MDSVHSGKGTLKKVGIGSVLLALLSSGGVFLYDIFYDTAKDEAKALLETYVRLTPERQRSMEGKWRGAITQVPLTSTSGANPPSPDTPSPLAYAVEFYFKSGLRRITGKIIVTSPNSNAIRNYTFSSGFIHDQYLSLEYQTSDSGSIAFGSAVLTLDLQGRTLNGFFIGIGDESNGFVSGHVTLHKQ
jgi:hypothetical protein